jgi:hypothetical protein
MVGGKAQIWAIYLQHRMRRLVPEVLLRGIKLADKVQRQTEIALSLMVMTVTAPARVATAEALSSAPKALPTATEALL